MCSGLILCTLYKIYGYRVKVRVELELPVKTVWGASDWDSVWRASCYLEGEEPAHPGVGGAQRRGGGVPPRWAQASQHYLEIMELECDWLEEVVAALSWENPLWLDSRLVMEPLKSSEPMTSV